MTFGIAHMFTGGYCAALFDDDIIKVVGQMMKTRR
jgi:hypothetical protein